MGSTSMIPDKLLLFMKSINQKLSMVHKMKIYQAQFVGDTPPFLWKTIGVSDFPVPRVMPRIPPGRAATSSSCGTKPLCRRAPNKLPPTMDPMESLEIRTRMAAMAMSQNGTQQMGTPNS